MADVHAACVPAFAYVGAQETCIDLPNHFVVAMLCNRETSMQNTIKEEGSQSAQCLVSINCVFASKCDTGCKAWLARHTSIQP
jgi:hypothetical protein